MARIEVEPDGLAAAGGAQQQLAARIVELAGRVERAGSAGGAAGDPALSEAIADCMKSWSAPLSMLSESVGGLGGNLGAAGAAYAATDSGAITEA